MAQTVVLVAGAAGFIGRNLLDALSARPGVRAVAGLRRAPADPVPAQSVHLDVCDGPSVEAALAATRPDVVINAAAYGVAFGDQDEDVCFAVNVTGALTLLRAARRAGVGRFIHLGSCFEYGSHAQAIGEGAQTRPTAFYGACKVAASALLLERGAAWGMDFLVARLFGVWGVYEPAHRLVPQILAAKQTGTPLDMTSGEQVRDFTFAGDMARDVVALATLAGRFDHPVVNVGSGVGQSVRDFATAVAETLGAADLLRPGARNQRSSEMAVLVADTARCDAMLGVRARTSLADGLALMGQTRVP